jgi:hypothetical protein
MKDSTVLKPLRHTEEPRELGYPTHVYPYTAGIVGGALGGLAMAVPALAYGWLSGHGIWYPINLVAATVLRSMQTMTPPQLAAFSLSALLVGVLIHLIVASGLGFVFALLLPTLPGRPIIWAVIVGPLLWFGATLIILPQINPVMSNLLDWPSFGLANIVYGLVMGGWVMRTPMVRAEQAHELHLHRPASLPR